MSNAAIVIRLVLLSAIFPLLIFPVAGRWDWMMGWAVALVMAATTIASRLLLLKKDPDLLQERARSFSAEDAEPWDKVLAPAMAISPLLVIVTASLDERFRWSSEVSPALQLTGLALLIAGLAFGTWAMLANHYFSGVVRIQTDRDHRVVSTGPYAIVRHPGYSGTVVACIGLALALSSWWALVPAALAIAVTIVRTSLEDRTLNQALPGYAEYANNTRYRLVPGLW